MKLFISYSHEDADFVDQITIELDFSTDLDIIIDKRCIRGGDSLLKIFEEIGEADYLIPIFSHNSIKSNWCQKELSVAIIKEIKEKTFKIIPVIKSGEDWKKLEKEMPDEIGVALSDKHVIDFGKKTYEEAFSDLVEALSPEVSPKDAYSYMADAEGENPFRRIRAEHIKDAETFAKLFAEPEIAHDALISPRPVILEGGRGSGKSMILKSLLCHSEVLIKTFWQ